jgi:hypothetical protein
VQKPDPVESFVGLFEGDTQLVEKVSTGLGISGFTDQGSNRRSAFQNLFTEYKFFFLFPEIMAQPNDAHGKFEALLGNCILRLPLLRFRLPIPNFYFPIPNLLTLLYQSLSYPEEE